MKTIVEFGIPQTALTVKRPCGVSGEIVCNSIKAGIQAANEIGFVLPQGQSSVNLKVAKDMPRMTFWSKDGKFWVSLSVLDRADRGAYAAKAYREAKENHEKYSSIEIGFQQPARVTPFLELLEFQDRFIA